MLQKIQPQQINLHTFTSSSGNSINAIQTDTGVDLNLSNTPSGNFNFLGSLRLNGRAPIFSSATNAADTENNSTVLGGSNNLATGVENIIVGASGSTVSGRQNLDLHGFNTSFGSGNYQNTVLAGANVIFPSSITGATVIKDGRNDSISPVGNHTLMIDFESGTYFNGPTRFLQNFSVGSSFSGWMSGKLRVDGEQFNFADLNVSGAIKATGQSFVSGQPIATEYWVGQRIASESSYVYRTGASAANIQEVSGTKRFFHNIEMVPDSLIKDSGASSSIIMQDAAQTYGSASDTGKNMVITSKYGLAVSLNSAGFAPAGSGILTNSANNSSEYMFRVTTGVSNIPSSAKFAVDQSGNSQVGGTLILKGNNSDSSTRTEYFPTGAVDANGVHGQVAYSGLYMALKNSGIWIRFSGESAW
jgi:hypothetical protein